MFFIASKLLRLLTDPVCLTFISGLLLLFFVRSHLKGLKKWGFYAGFAFLWTAHTSLFSGYLMYLLEYSVSAPEKYDEGYDYAVILSGFVDLEQPIRESIPEFGDGIDRLLAAVPLIRENRTDKLILSGGNGSLERRLPGEAQLNADFLIRYMNVPAERIIVENESKNTYENALYTSRIIGKHSKKVILITSASHMLRAYLVFKKQGIETHPFIVDYRSKDIFSIYSLPYYIFPNTGGADALRTVIQEYIGIVMYRLAGYI